jgi:hypothetical protein
LRHEEHQLGTLVRTIVTCETCHRTLSSTIGVAGTTPAEPEPVASVPAPAAEPALTAPKPSAQRKPAAKPAKSAASKTRAAKKGK